MAGGAMKAVWPDQARTTRAARCGTLPNVQVHAVCLLTESNAQRLLVHPPTRTDAPHRLAAVNACERRTDCKTCLADPFCGWCGASGRCFEGNSHGAYSEPCRRGWTRAPVPLGTSYEAVVQRASSAADALHEVDGLCAVSDAMARTEVEEEVERERKYNETLRMVMETCAPCHGEWPMCDCGGNDPELLPYPIDADLVQWDGDEAVGVDTAELHRRRVRADMAAKNASAAAAAAAEEHDELASQLGVPEASARREKAADAQVAKLLDDVLQSAVTSNPLKSMGGALHERLANISAGTQEFEPGSNEEKYHQLRTQSRAEKLAASALAAAQELAAHSDKAMSELASAGEDSSKALQDALQAIMRAHTTSVVADAVNGTVTTAVTAAQDVDGPGSEPATRNATEHAGSNAAAAA